MSILKKNAKYVAAFVVVLAGIVAFQIYTSESVSGKPDEKPAEAGKVSQTEAPAQAWNVRCAKEEDMKAEEKRGKCEIVQKLTVQETGQRFAEFAIGIPEGKEQAQGVMILPLGVLLKSGVEMKVDDQQAFKFDIRFCQPAGCVAFLNLSEAVLDTFKNGKAAHVEFKAADGKPVKFEMPLNGFGKALEEVS